MNHDDEPADDYCRGPNQSKAAESTHRCDGAFWHCFIPALIVGIAAVAGVVFSLGPRWQLVCNGFTLLGVTWVLWEGHRKRKRRAAIIAAQLDELLELLNSGNTGLSSAQLWKFEVQLKRLQLEMLRGANLPK